jgi:hypothetical protein
MFRATVVYTPRLGSPPACCSGDEPPEQLTISHETRSAWPQRERMRDRIAAAPCPPHVSHAARSIRPRESSQNWWRRTGPHDGVIGRGERGRPDAGVKRRRHLAPRRPTNHPPPLLAESLPFPTGFFYAAYGSCRRNHRKNVERVRSCCFLCASATMWQLASRPNDYSTRDQTHGSVIYIILWMR